MSTLLSNIGSPNPTYLTEKTLCEDIVISIERRCWVICRYSLPWQISSSLFKQRRKNLSITVFLREKTLLRHQAPCLAYRILVDIVHLICNMLPAKLEYRGACRQAHVLEDSGIFQQRI